MAYHNIGAPHLVTATGSSELHWTPSRNESVCGSSVAWIFHPMEGRFPLDAVCVDAYPVRRWHSKWRPDSSPQPGESVQRFDFPKHRDDSFSNCWRFICIAVCIRRGDSVLGVHKTSFPWFLKGPLGAVQKSWLPFLADGESVQRLTGDLTSQNKTTDMLEVVAAIVVTAGLVAGNLLLFSPLRIDNRIKAPAQEDQPVNTTRPVFWWTTVHVYAAHRIPAICS